MKAKHDGKRLLLGILLTLADLAGLTVSGCLFQLLKEKSGTLWLPVLLHAFLDYSVVLTY